MCQTEQTNDGVWARPNRLNSVSDKTEDIQFGQDRTGMYWPVGAVPPKICADYELGRTGPLVRDPDLSGPYLSWIGRFILGNISVTIISILMPK